MWEWKDSKFLWCGHRPHPNHALGSSQHALIFARGNYWNREFFFQSCKNRLVTYRDQWLHWVGDGFSWSNGQIEFQQLSQDGRSLQVVAATEAGKKSKSYWTYWSMLVTLTFWTPPDDYGRPVSSKRTHHCEIKENIIISKTYNKSQIAYTYKTYNNYIIMLWHICKNMQKAKIPRCSVSRTKSHTSTIYNWFCVYLRSVS